MRKPRKQEKNRMVENIHLIHIVTEPRVGKDDDIRGRICRDAEEE